MTVINYTYRQEGELTDFSSFFGECLEKRDTASKFCIDYYPFGLQHNTSWTRPFNGNNSFLYNAGSELNALTHNYETAFRRYDPALGRFNGADALASGAPSLSPYRFGFNNPVSFNDPTGLNEKPYIDAERGGGGIISGGENFGSYYGWDNSVNDYWNGYRSEYGNSFMMSEQDFQQRYGKGADEYRQDLAKLNAIRDAITELSGQMPQSDGYGGYKVTSYYTLNHSYYGNQDSYAGAFYIQPSVIRIRGLNSDSEPFFDLSSLFSDQGREPYEGFWGKLDYFWTGGIEDGIRYNINGKFLGRVSSGLGAAAYISGPGGASKLTVKGLKLLKQENGIWKWAVNGRVASQETLEAYGLTKPALNTTTKISEISKSFEETISGVQNATGPLSTWGKIKQIIAVGFQWPF